MVRDDPRERLHFMRPEAEQGSEILFATDSLQPWHVFHERYAICACATAAAGWRYRGREGFLGDRSISIMEPGETHFNTRVGKRSDFKVVFVDAERMALAASELQLPAAPHFGPTETYDEPLFAALEDYALDMRLGTSRLAQESSLHEFLQRLLRFAERIPRPAAPAAPHELVRARDFIRANASEDISLSAVASVAGLSRFHLLREFKRHFGFPPHAFQTHVRIERATTGLRRGLPIAEAATLAGFADQSHFTRHFKRIWRTTPGTYARAGRENDRGAPDQKRNWPPLEITASST